MKIVCDACAAKYSIADEKVAGKVFKIRCKKCSNVIVVRGSADGEGAAPELEQKETRVFDYSGYDSPQDAVAAADSGLGDGAVWHVVIDQEQVGPLSPEEVRAHFARGAIDGESFIWREGFADWERLDSLQEFADLAGSHADDAAAAMFGGPSLDDGGADVGDLFSAQLRPVAAVSANEGIFGGAADDGGLFGGAAAHAPEMVSASAVDDKLKGQRNENSVLFSLNNLASLASDSPRPSASSSASMSSSSSSSSSGMAQSGGQEGSGLIDIRAMASMYVGDDRSSAGPARIDDLPVFSQPVISAASPVLMPVAQPAGNNKLLIALIAGIGALVVVAVLLIVLVLKGSGDGGQKQAANNNQTNAAGDGDGDKAAGEPGDGEKAGDGDGEGSGTAAETGEDAAAAKAAAAEEKKKQEEAAAEARRKEREEALKNETPSERRAREKKEAKEREERKKADEERRKKAAEDKKKQEEAAKNNNNSSSSKGCDELDCLVNPGKACCKGKGGTTSSNDTKKDVDSSLPVRPTSAQLSSGIGKAKGAANSCASKENFSGKVSVKVKITPAGSVSSASASGGSGGVNSCVAAAVKSRASFPKSQDGVSFTYSFRF